jgi:peptidoglycan/xylan/chitin deacetylase (PgdA/CDA1 family)
VLTLTFDDGPDPEFTPKVLEVLAEHRIRATFNVMGFNAEQHSDGLHATVAAGHEIGNHTFSHRDLAFQMPQTTMSELRRGLEVIQERTGLERVRWCRPPRGELTGVAARYAARLGHDILLWTLLGDTAGHERPDQVSSFVIPELGPGKIVAFHDGIGRGTFAPKGRNAKSLRQRRAAEIRPNRRRYRRHRCSMERQA